LQIRKVQLFFPILTKHIYAKVNQQAKSMKISPYFIIIGILTFILSQSCKPQEIIDTNKEKPNVLFISIDDLNDWIEPLGGHPQALTPNISSFSEEASNFIHAYCASPGCNPSRGAILTGLNTYTTGLYSNYQDWREIPLMMEGPTLNSYFKDNGYYTAGAGKIYHYDQTDTLGWDDYFPSKSKPMPMEYFPKETPVNMPVFKYMYRMFDWGPLDIDDKQTPDYQSVNYIQSQLAMKHEKPFFLACGIYRPHVPWYVPQKYFDLFPLDSIELPKLIEEDLNDISEFAKNEIVERGGDYHKHVVEAKQWRKAIQGYLASMAFADAMLGELLNALKNSDYADNTVIVLWSDHGWQLGEKRHWRKFALWENVNRSVLMIKAPEGSDHLSSQQIPGNVTSLVSLVDIYPTLLDLCGLPKLEQLDGKSLLPFIQNSELSVDRPVITTYDYGSYSVRFKNWHLIKYIDESEELYNLDEDPEEWYNLAEKADLTNVLVELRGFIPKAPVDLPIESLITLSEHHIAPIQSKAHFESLERKEWMKRFKQ
jgi:arylsulfatase A-like enzyme